MEVLSHIRPCFLGIYDIPLHRSYIWYPLNDFDWAIFTSKLPVYQRVGISNVQGLVNVLIENHPHIGEYNLQQILVQVT